MDEDDLMRRAAAGDAAAFGCVVRAYQRRLVRFAAWMLGDADAAEDVVQDAFVRLWRHRNHYQAQGRLEPLLLRIVRNLCRDRARAVHSTAAWDDETLLFAPDGDPEAQAQARTCADAVRHAVATLPEPQRVVFVLNHYEGLSYREIADALGCPIGTVASRKHHAIEALRWQLRSWFEEATDDC